MRNARRIFFLLVAALILTGCGTSEPSAQTVRLLTQDSFVVSEELLAELKADTGIDLEIISAGGAGTVVASAILASGNPTADLLFGVDNILLDRALEADVFEPYVSPERDELAPSVLPDTDAVTPIEYGDVCINIDDRWFEANGVTPPSTLEDLRKPEYRGLLVVQDPGTSSPGVAFLLATIARYGDAWTDYWSDLRDNDVEVAGSWSDAYYGSFTQGGGNRPLVVSYATSPPAEIVYADDPKPTTVSTSVMEDGCYRQVRYAGILRGAQNSEGAARVIDWLISSKVQADVPLSMFVFPARMNVELPEVFVEFAAEIADPLQLPPVEVERNLSSWLTTWGEVMGR
jgi:thiamine transport system substrate-binding protein